MRRWPLLIGDQPGQAGETGRIEFDATRPPGPLVAGAPLALLAGNISHQQIDAICNVPPASAGTSCRTAYGNQDNEGRQGDDHA